MLRKIYYALPPNFRFIARFLYYLPHDLIVYITESEKVISPPKRLIYIGSGDYIKIGKLFQEDFIRNNLINTGSIVLDVGCGIGRSAIPLTNYLTSGKYYGFDIIKSGIHWCKKNISSKFPNFDFKLVDLSNDLYKSKGNDASTFEFPYQNETFDLVIVLSVFTHLVQNEVEQYIKEINRVLKVDGFCYATFFILNDDSKKNMDVNNGKFNFKYSRGTYSLLDNKVQSANVAYEENYLMNSLFPGNNFTVQSCRYGSWSTSHPADPIGFQDRVILRKQSNNL